MPITLYTRKEKSKTSIKKITFKITSRGFPDGAVVGNLPGNAEDTGLSPGLGGSHMPPSN